MPTMGLEKYGPPLILRCAPDCPFGRRCAEKARDGECETRVTNIPQEDSGLAGFLMLTEIKGAQVILEEMVDPTISQTVIVEEGVAQVYSRK